MIATSIPILNWVWEDFSKYKEISVNICVGDEEYQCIYIPVIYLTDKNRKFYINDTVYIVANNCSLYFMSDNDASVMALIAR